MKMRNHFIPADRATLGIIRWAKPFTAIMKGLISPKGISRAAARGCELATDLLNADFVRMFLIVQELHQTDRPFYKPRNYGTAFWPGTTLAHWLRTTFSKLGVFGGSLVGSSKLASKAQLRLGGS